MERRARILLTVALTASMGRMLGESIWWEVTTEEGFYGWIPARFTAQGPTTDWSSVIIGSLGGIPEERTIESLGEVVGNALAPDPTVLRTS